MEEMAGHKTDDAGCRCRNSNKDIFIKGMSLIVFLMLHIDQ